MSQAAMNETQKGLVVKQAGPLALIQDVGRFGVGHLGVTQAAPPTGSLFAGLTGYWATL